MKPKLADISLILLTLSFLIMLGGGNYEAINITPVIASAPPRSLSMLQGEFGFNPMRFWIVFQILTTLLFIVALIFNWKHSIFRKRVLIGCFLGMIALRIVTLLYFAPETGVIASAPFADTVDADLMARAQRWEVLNYLRLFGFYVIGICLLVTLSRRVESDRTQN